MVQCRPHYTRWEQTTQAEFDADTLTGTESTAEGSVVLAGGGASLQDGFDEGDTVGQLPSGWEVTPMSGHTVQVTDTTAHSAPHSLLLQDDNQATGKDIDLVHAFDSGSRLRVDVWVHCQVGGGYERAWNLLLSNDELMAEALNPHYALQVYGVSNQIGWYDGTGHPVLTPAAANAWQKITLRVDAISGTYEILIDDTSVQTDAL